MATGNSAVMRKAMLDALSLPAFILLFTMMGFGSLARGAGFGADMAAIATLLIWGLPGQLAMVELTVTGQGIVAIVFACSLANARFLPMVVSFVPAMSRGRANLLGRSLDAQLLSINSWAMCLREFPRVEPACRHLYYVTFAGSIMSAAVIGTLAGFAVLQRWGLLASAGGGVVLLIGAGLCSLGGHTGGWLVAQYVTGAAILGISQAAFRRF